MFKRFVYLTISVVMAANVACSTQYANTKMDKELDGVVLSTNELKGENLGPIKGERGGAIWDSCEKHSGLSVVELVRAAKAKGANAVGNIRWTAKDSTDPSCKKGWGYLILPVFILTPLFMSTEVTGIAYKTSSGSNHKGFFMLPNSPEEEEAFIKKILALR
jgi:hypothetical protein